MFSYSIWSLWCLTQPELACRGLAEQTGEQGDESRADQHHTPASHELLDTLRFSRMIIVSVAFHEVNNTPHCETRAKRNNERLKNRDWPD